MLHELLADHQHYHSDLQMDSFITTRCSGGTVYGCYKQSLRELDKRVRSIESLDLQRELMQIDIEDLEQSDSLDKFTARRQQVAIRQKRLELLELDKSLADTEREFGRFYAQAVALKSEIGELTPERRAALDEDMWVHRLGCQAAIDIMVHGSLRAGTIELLQSLPLRLRTEVRQRFFEAGKESLLSWFMSFEFSVPEGDPHPVNVRALLGHSSA